MVNVLEWTIRGSSTRSCHMMEELSITAANGIISISSKKLQKKAKTWTWLWVWQLKTSSLKAMATTWKSRQTRPTVTSKRLRWSSTITSCTVLTTWVRMDTACHHAVPMPSTTCAKKRCTVRKLAAHMFLDWPKCSWIPKCPPSTDAWTRKSSTPVSPLRSTEWRCLCLVLVITRVQRPLTSPARPSLPRSYLLSLWLASDWSSWKFDKQLN